MKTYASFGEWLRWQRRALDLTQEGLARQVACSPITIRKLETDERRPSRQLAQRIAECLQLSPQDTARFLALARGGSAPDPSTSVTDSLSMVARPEVPSARDHPALARQDWGGAPDGTVFVGRQPELAQLQQWLLQDRCRLMAVLGMGGIGKTALVATLADQLQDEFDYVIWRSLREAPPLDEILDQCLRFLSNQQIQDLTASLARRIDLLLDYLRRHRCLLILDNAEAIMRSGARAGAFLTGYEGYGQLLRQVGESRHQSCLVLTSREKPRELVMLEGETAPVRTLHLASLDVEEVQSLLQQQGLSGSEASWAELTMRYSGNPLALKVVAETIRELFAGQVDRFLRADTTLFGHIQELLAQQVARLSPLEQDVLFWLAVAREPATLDGLRADLVQPVSSVDLLEALRALRRRSLLESSAAGFTLQNVVMEYATDALVDQMCAELQDGSMVRLQSHCLIQAQAKEYVRASQTRLILKRVADRLLALWDKTGLEARLGELVAVLRQTQPRVRGYAGGNIVNLLVHIESDLRGGDFSGLAVWQAYLRNVDLQDATFVGADLARTVFADTFGGIEVVTFSPDGTRLVAGTFNGEIRVWHYPDCQPLLTWLGHTGMVRSVGFSPDGRLLASSSTDGSVRLWEPQSGRALASLAGHGGPIRSLCFSPDGRMLAGACEDSNIYLWDVQTHECLAVLHGHSHWALSVCFSPDGARLASGSFDQTVRLWDVASGACLHVLPVDTDMPVSVCFSPDGTLLAGQSRDHGFSLWDAASGQPLATWTDHTEHISSLCFRPDGLMLASSSEDATVRLWAIGSHPDAGQCLRVLQGHRGHVRSVCFSPDGRVLVSGSHDESVRLWDAESGECLHILQGYSGAILSVGFSPDGRLLASGISTGVVHLWDVGGFAGGRRWLAGLPGHSGIVYAVCFAPDGQTLASASRDGTVRLWDVASRACLATLHEQTPWLDVYPICFSPDGSLLASSGSEETVHLWDVRRRQQVQTLTGHTHPVQCIDFSPGGATLASADYDGVIRLWDVRSGHCWQVLRGHTHWIRAIRFSPSGQLLASSGYDKSVRIWDLDRGECLATLHGHSGWVVSVCFHPDGQILASSSEDQTVRLWDVANPQDGGGCLQVLQGHTAWVSSVQFSPDGRTLASGSADGTIKLWEMGSRSAAVACLQTLHADRPYERMNIRRVTGISEDQRAALTALGAIADG